MHGLSAPLGAHEFGGQPIQQSRVAWGGSLRAEVVFRLHNAFSKIMQPHPVDCDTRHQGIVSARDPAGKIQTISGFRLGE